jgi:AcrR family transcriptional regulator
VVGRIAGVTAAEIRERLLHAAAEVFAERGYDGTRVADIATVAGVSNAALYAHFGSKAELLVQALKAHGPRLLADVLRADPDRPVGEALLVAGRRLPSRGDGGRSLIVEALVAVRRDRKVARLMRTHLGEREEWLADLVRAGQLAGELDPALSPAAVAHFCLLLAMGSALVPHGLRGVDPDAWDALLRRLVAALTPPSEESHESHD